MDDLQKAIRDLHSPTFDALWDAHLKEVERLTNTLREWQEGYPGELIAEVKRLREDTQAWSEEVERLQRERDFVAGERDRLMRAVEESRVEIERLHNTTMFVTNQVLSRRVERLQSHEKILLAELAEVQAESAALKEEVERLREEK
jgi:chromosome segregation ATPase